MTRPLVVLVVTLLVQLGVNLIALAATVFLARRNGQRLRRNHDECRAAVCALGPNPPSPSAGLELHLRPTVPSTVVSAVLRRGRRSLKGGAFSQGVVSGSASRGAPAVGRSPTATAGRMSRPGAPRPTAGRGPCWPAHTRRSCRRRRVRRLPNPGTSLRSAEALGAGSLCRLVVLPGSHCCRRVPRCGRGRVCRQLSGRPRFARDARRWLRAQ